MWVRPIFLSESSWAAIGTRGDHAEGSAKLLAVPVLLQDELAAQVDAGSWPLAVRGLEDAAVQKPDPPGLEPSTADQPAQALAQE